MEGSLAAAELPDRDEGTGPYALYVGRHADIKQVESIPAALAAARRTIPELRGVIVGEGATTPLIRAEVERLGLQDAIDLPGIVTDEQLGHLLANASVLVNPSKREGYGLPVIEACAYGTPVVIVEAIDNAMIDLVEPGVNGFIAPSTAPEQFGEAIVNAIQAGPALRRTTRTWFEEAAKTDTIEASAMELLDFFAVGSASPRRGMRRRRTTQGANR
jgi:glycosyltransferase involved in cell wall biosynthesis